MRVDILKQNAMNEFEHQGGYNPDSDQADSNDAEYRSNRILETLEARQKVAQEFIGSLSVQPPLWRLSGSSADGSFRPDSDVDVEALYAKEEDIPFQEFESRRDPVNGLIDGCIDFHYFAEDWGVYKADPALLERFKASFTA